MKPFELTHETLKDYSHKDELLSLYYRSKYGGMKGDIEMLVNSIYYYIGNPLLIGRSSININYEFSISYIIMQICYFFIIVLLKCIQSVRSNI